MSEDTFNFDDAIHMAKEHGERFIGWYSYKKPLNKETIPFKYQNEMISYQFITYDYNYRFVMPTKIEFIGGSISYTDPERMLGVFRFPRDEEGNFITPFSISKEEINKMMELPEKDLKKILFNRKPLVFNAFSIPQFGFEIFNINEFNFKELINLTDLKFAHSVKEELDRIIALKVEEVKQKILSKPNYLLILRNVLDRQLQDFKEVSDMTEKIIHI